MTNDWELCDSCEEGVDPAENAPGGFPESF